MCFSTHKKHVFSRVVLHPVIPENICRCRSLKFAGSWCVQGAGCLTSLLLGTLRNQEVQSRGTFTHFSLTLIFFPYKDTLKKNNSPTSSIGL